MSDELDLDPVLEAADAVPEAAPPPSTVATEPAARSARLSPFGSESGRFWLLATTALAVVTIIVASWSTVFVFAVGAAIALLMLPIVSWLQRKGLGRGLAAALLVFLLVVIVAVSLIGVFLIIVNQGIPFLQALPGFIDSLYAQLTAMGLPDYIQQAIDSLFATIDQRIAEVDAGALALGFLRGVLGFLAGLLSLLIVPFFIFYLVKDQPSIAHDLSAQIPVQTQRHIRAVGGIFRDDFVAYFKGELMVGGIMFAIITIGMLVIGLIVGGPLGDFAFFLGLVAFLMEFIPTIGPIISMIPALLIAITISPVAFAIVFVFYIVAFQVESAILVPTIEGKVISFRPATILLLIAMGFALGGIIGAIVVLPVAAIARDLFSYFFRATDPNGNAILPLAEATAAAD